MSDKPDTASSFRIFGCIPVCGVSLQIASEYEHDYLIHKNVASSPHDATFCLEPVLFRILPVCQNHFLKRHGIRL